MAAHNTTPIRSHLPAGRVSQAPLDFDRADASASGTRRTLGAGWNGGPAPSDRVPTIALHGSPNHLADNVLGAHEFETILARERDLADRGTRFFTLMVLRDRDVEARALNVFALRLRERLRSTDLVGRIGSDQLGLLLSDTALEGAQIVGDWIDTVAAEVGLQLDAMIYAYPSVDEARSTALDEEETESDGLEESLAERDASANGSPREEDSMRDTDSVLEDRSPQGRWPVADLWCELSEPIPMWKRTLDILGAGTALVALSPLLLCTAIAIKLDSPGPVIFCQKRAGRGARPFDFFKFRSMHVGAEARRAELAAKNEQEGPIFKMRNDPRVTRVGRILRRWSIDELPQLWNILRGDLSLVGPRSPTFDEVAKYERWQRRRLNVTGGVTCIWQVSGRSQVGFRDWMRMDLRYVRARGLWLDLCLLAKTVPAVLTCKGAY
ncbi:MAG TPA: sugar transferase [Planctomycetota bacterium]|nr:sugar transferase [Planctomycetota bacterium]